MLNVGKVMGPANGQVSNASGQWALLETEAGVC